MHVLVFRLLLIENANESRLEPQKFREAGSEATKERDIEDVSLPQRTQAGELCVALGRTQSPRFLVMI
jgi:hypothetical protein